VRGACPPHPFSGAILANTSFFRDSEVLGAIGERVVPWASAQVLECFKPVVCAFPSGPRGLHRLHTIYPGHGDPITQDIEGFLRESLTHVRASVAAIPEE